MFFATSIKKKTQTDLPSIFFFHLLLKSRLVMPCGWMLQEATLKKCCFSACSCLILLSSVTHTHANTLERTAYFQRENVFYRRKKVANETVCPRLKWRVADTDLWLTPWPGTHLNTVCWANHTTQLSPQLCRLVLKLKKVIFNWLCRRNRH